MKISSVSASLLNAIPSPIQNLPQIEPSPFSLKSLASPALSHKSSKSLKPSNCLTERSPESERRSIEEAYEYLMLRDIGISKKKAISIASQIKTSDKKIYSMKNQSEAKLKNPINKEKFKSYKPSKEQINLDKINLDLKKAIKKRMLNKSKKIKQPKTQEKNDFLSRKNIKKRLTKHYLATQLKPDKNEVSENSKAFPSLSIGQLDLKKHFVSSKFLLKLPNSKHPLSSHRASL